jgi:hypothetical protein
MWRNSLVVPACISAASATILALHVALLSRPVITFYESVIPKSNRIGIKAPSSFSYMQ